MKTAAQFLWNRIGSILLVGVWLGFCCCWVASFFGCKSGICEAKGKPSELIVMSFLRSQSPYLDAFVSPLLRVFLYLFYIYVQGFPLCLAGEIRKSTSTPSSREWQLLFYFKANSCNSLCQILILSIPSYINLMPQRQKQSAPILVHLEVSSRWIGLCAGQPEKPHAVRQELLVSSVILSLVLSPQLLTLLVFS